MRNVYLIVHEECLEMNIKDKNKEKAASAQAVKEEIDRIRHNFDNEIFNLPFSEGFNIPVDLPKDIPIILMGAYASKDHPHFGYCIERVERILREKGQSTKRHDKGIIYKGYLD